MEKRDSFEEDEEIQVAILSHDFETVSTASATLREPEVEVPTTWAS